MKKLLITTDFWPLGGGVSEYYQQRIKEEKDVVILMHAKTKKERKFYNSKIYFRNFYYTFIWPKWLRLFFLLFKFTKKIKPDFLWVGQVLPIGTAVWLRHLINKKPYIVTCHGNDLLRAKKNKRKFWIAKKILNSAKAVEANTNFVRDLLIKHFKVSAKKIKVIKPKASIAPDEVNNKVRQNLINKYNLENKKVILTVARLVESKGIDGVIKAMSKVWQVCSEAVYLVVGSGSEAESLKKMAKEVAAEKHSGQIIFAGEVNHNLLANYYSLADLFVMIPKAAVVPDYDQDIESFGIVYEEANNFNIPIIAGDIGGVREIVAQDITLINSKNYKKMPELILNKL